MSIWFIEIIKKIKLKNNKISIQRQPHLNLEEQPRPSDHRPGDRWQGARVQCDACAVRGHHEVPGEGDVVPGGVEPGDEDVLVCAAEEAGLLARPGRAAAGRAGGWRGARVDGAEWRRHADGHWRGRRGLHAGQGGCQGE